MTKRLTIALVAVVLFVLMVVMPVSAAGTGNTNGTQIDKGATIFIGEAGLNLTHAINQGSPGYFVANGNFDGVPANLSIGWWASAAVIRTTAPTQTVRLNNDYRSYTVTDYYAPYLNNWYQLVNDGSGVMTDAVGNPIVVFSVQDPSLGIAVWDFDQGTNAVGSRTTLGTDVTGKTVVQGEKLGFKINTNMEPATYSSRNNTLWDRHTTVSGLGFLPSTNYSAWNTNATGTGNLSFVERTWTNQPATVGTNQPIFRVTNWSDVVLTTYNSATGATILTGYKSTMYWNSTPMPVGALTGFTDWSYYNYTIATTGNPANNRTLDNWDAAPVAENTTIFAPLRATDGWITIKVKDANGATYNRLQVGSSATVNTAVSLLRNFPDVAPLFFGDFGNYWVTDATDFNNQYLYPVGTYQAWAESTLNGMKDNYKLAGADYTGKTISATGTVTLSSDTVKIESNKDSVVRSKPFAVTITGKPSTAYYVWVKGTNTMTSVYDDQPPMININQEGVFRDDAVNAGATGGLMSHPIGNYEYQNGNWAILFDNVAANTSAQFNKTRYYGMANTSTSGTRVVEWTTNNWTKAQKYTIRVEQHMPYWNNITAAGQRYNTGGEFKSDEVDVKVEKGAVTIVAAGDQSYYLGEEIKFSGTNTETYNTYLFITGPNLKTGGSSIKSTNPRAVEVVNNNPAEFQVAPVAGDNTWSWKWGTSTVALDAGTYTIYAVSTPNNALNQNLENSAFGTVSIIIKKPFVSATASQSTVAKGDKVFITGTAEGNPIGVKIWILGKNYPSAATDIKTQSVNSDASFKYELAGTSTKGLFAGQYFVVVQHPMQNNVFDITTCTDTNKICNLQTPGGAATGTIFSILGASSLQGSDAAEALVQGINSPNVDDTYTKLQFLVEEPIIRVDPVGDKHVGDKFTITASTNLAVDDEVLVQVYSSSFKPTQKSQSGEFSGATGTVKVAKGDSGMNKILFDVDSSTFKPDEYIVTEAAILQDITGTALFNVLEGAAPVVTTKAPVTTVAPVVTTAAPVVTTVPPTPVPTTKSPGYGALIALIGLGAVAFIVVRRH